MQLFVAGLVEGLGGCMERRMKAALPHSFEQGRSSSRLRLNFVMTNGLELPQGDGLPATKLLFSVIAGEAHRATIRL